MAAIMLQGEKEKYVFSVLERGSNFPECSGFYLLIKSDDKYGIRDKHILAVGHSDNLKKDKIKIEEFGNGYTHAYMMPDFERQPQQVLKDLEKTLTAWEEEAKKEDRATVKARNAS